MKSFYAAVLVAIARMPASEGAEFFVTPSSVVEDSNGRITLEVAGLAAGERVLAQKFLDLNGDGTIDPGEPITQQFELTDGEAGMVIGGVANANVPGDSNPAAGAITARLQFNNGDFLQRVVGTYLYKVSSPTGQFEPRVQRLNVIEQIANAQVLSGEVTAGGNPVPYAVVLAGTDREGNGPGSPVRCVLADGNGRYSIRLPAAAYNVLAYAPGFVCEWESAGAVQLAAGQTTIWNLSLTAAGETISGWLADAANGAKKIPGAFVAAISAEGMLATGFTDASGDFRLSVTGGTWRMAGVDWGLILHGYVANEDIAPVAAGATGVAIRVNRANALYYGFVRRRDGTAVAGADVESENRDYSQWSKGVTDENGYYVVGAAVGAGESSVWDVDVDDDADAGSFLYSLAPAAPPIGVGEARQVNFTQIDAATTVSGHLRDVDENGIGGIGIWANASIDGLSYHVDSVRTDANGYYTFRIADGAWSIGGFLSLPPQYDWPPSRNVTIAGKDVAVDFVALAINDTRPRLRAPRIADGEFRLTLIAHPYRWYAVQFSEDLSADRWVTEAMVRNEDVMWPVAIEIDPERENAFFRAVLDPDFFP